MSVYNMPIWLRKYYIKKIVDFNEDQGVKMNLSTSTKTITKQNTILRPAIKPPQN